MPIYIDLDKCDQNPDCPAASYCVPMALQFDKEKNRLVYDPAKCKNCGTCVVHCGPVALYQYNDEEELKLLKEELERMKTTT
ncbi:4Fe-4S ferredoxin [Calderihabitans maritimus]|uniref:(Fe-S)-binding protein n=1 Tax=Calderihabitans maritimus TaxID=1246530 RepID=A0A1Z5HR02_9FIRM|nr:4Fe-4S ferredoxin [Calderihabitans maritimus]GAW91956.1 (Fe-S)-binding protein [Calderihabitans maritimus]